MHGCVPVQVEARGRDQLSYLAVLNVNALRQGLRLNQKLTQLGTFAAQRTVGVCLSLAPMLSAGNLNSLYALNGITRNILNIQSNNCRICTLTNNLWNSLKKNKEF